MERVRQEQEVSEEVMLLACWQTLLARLTGKNSVLVKSCFDGRNTLNFMHALGLFHKWPPCR